MGWQLIAQIAWAGVVLITRGRLQPPDLAHQSIDLVLLANDDLIEPVEQVFGVNGFDFECRQAPVDVVTGVGHGGVLQSVGG